MHVAAICRRKMKEEFSVEGGWGENNPLLSNYLSSYLSIYLSLFLYIYRGVCVCLIREGLIGVGVQLCC